MSTIGLFYHKMMIKTNKTDTISSALGAEESTIFLMNTYTQIIYILLYHTKVVS
jgi:hypothetical protein